MAEISTDDLQMQIDFSTNEAADIRRCLATLLSTREGTAPMRRTFGIDQSFMDYPGSVAQTLFVQEITKKVAMFEARVAVQSVSWTATAAGKLIPKVVFTHV